MWFLGVVLPQCVSQQCVKVPPPCATEIASSLSGRESERKREGEGALQSATSKELPVAAQTNGRENKKRLVLGEKEKLSRENDFFKQ